MLEVDRIPRTFIVVGGGVIGSEYATVYAALGTTKVTLIEGRDRILNFLDKEIGDGLAAAMTRLGVDILVNDQVAQYDRRADGTGVFVAMTPAQPRGSPLLRALRQELDRAHSVVTTLP